MRTLAELKALTPTVILAAQRVYDTWNPDDPDDPDDPYAGGGICDDIADAIAPIVDGCPQFVELDHHTVVLVAVTEGVVRLDIPARVYERGYTYAWTKIPGVTFEAEDVAFDILDPDPTKLEEYLD